MFSWLLILILALEALATILLIGQRRKPITREHAALEVVINGLLIWGIVVHFR